MGLASSKTLENLKASVIRESQAGRRYQSFAERADLQGRSVLAAAFRSIALGEAGHAEGHLAFMEDADDPGRLEGAVVGQTHESADRYSGMARTARDEGFEDVADWFETLARAEASRAARFRRLLGAQG